jgi:hypothetical protein
MSDSDISWKISETSGDMSIWIASSIHLPVETINVTCLAGSCLLSEAAILGPNAIVISASSLIASCIFDKKFSDSEKGITITNWLIIPRRDSFPGCPRLAKIVATITSSMLVYSPVSGSMISLRDSYPRYGSPFIPTLLAVWRTVISDLERDDEMRCLQRLRSSQNVFVVTAIQSHLCIQIERRQELSVLVIVVVPLLGCRLRT